MTFIPLPVQESGDQKRVWTADDEVRELLRQILEEQQITNAHLATITGEQVTEQDARKD